MSNSSCFIPAQTKTGGFPIGIRRGWSDWQRDLPGLLAWLRDNRIGTLDFGPDGKDYSAEMKEAGLRIGSHDLTDLKDLISPDPAERAAAVEKNAALIASATAACGPLIFFTVMLPKDPARPRSENFGYLVESYNKLSPVLEANGGRVVVEGWPGPGALCCTPEGYGEFISRCPSTTLGVNYDPSHLVRMGIDPIRFLREFVGRVFHAHGKDTELLSEGLYRYGSEQAPTFGEPRSFGGMHWRYTVPGHGGSDWPAILRILQDAGYRGAISIELEDDHFNGTEAGEKKGLLASRDFLAAS